MNKTANNTAPANTALIQAINRSIKTKQDEEAARIRQNANSLQNALRKIAIMQSTQKDWELTDVDADGNCFYYALHGAAKHHGLLNIVCEVLHQQDESCSENPKAFATKAREFVAYTIETKSCASYSEFEKNIAGVIKDGFVPNGLYGPAIEKILPLLNNPRNICTFRRRLADLIRSDGHWATHIDIAIVKHMLDKRGVILLNSITETKNRLLTDPKVPIAPNELQLVLQDHKHYKYIAYGTAAQKQMDTSTFDRLMTRLMKGGRAKAKKINGKGASSKQKNMAASSGMRKKPKPKQNK